MTTQSANTELPLSSTINSMHPGTSAMLSIHLQQRRWLKYVYGLDPSEEVQKVKWAISLSKML